MPTIRTYRETDGALVGYLTGCPDSAAFPSESQRTGFVAHGPTPLVPGLRYEGRRVHQLTMVRG